MVLRLRVQKLCSAPFPDARTYQFPINRMLLLLYCGIWNCELRALLPVRSIRSQLGKAQNQRFRVLRNVRVQPPTIESPPLLAIEILGGASVESRAYLATPLIEDVNLWRGGETSKCGLVTNGEDGPVRSAESSRKVNAALP